MALLGRNAGMAVGVIGAGGVGRSSQAVGPPPTSPIFSLDVGEGPVFPRIHLRFQRVRGVVLEYTVWPHPPLVFLRQASYRTLAAVALRRACPSSFYSFPGDPVFVSSIIPSGDPHSGQAYLNSGPKSVPTSTTCSSDTS